jgi:hypothetical protein
MNKINWFGLVGSVLTLALVVVSLFWPWWRLTAGQNIMVVGTSPVATNISLLGKSLTIPLIWAANLSGLLSFSACGVFMLIYSVVPLKSYSKHLLNFAYLTTLYGVILEFVGVFAAVSVMNSYLGLSIPVSGSIIGTLPSSLVKDVTIKVVFSTGFLWPFWFAVVTSGFCVAAKVYHLRMVKTLIS